MVGSFNLSQATEDILSRCSMSLCVNICVVGWTWNFGLIIRWGASPHLKSALRKRIGHSFGSKVPMQKLHLEGLAICKRFQSSNPDGCCVREVN